MIIQMHITDDELTRFFTNAGYATKVETEIEFLSLYHNRTEPKEVDVLHVVDADGFSMSAKEVFQNAMKRRVCMPDSSTIDAIKTVLNESFNPINNNNGKS